ncbi:hypothetical protein CR513_39687, partial [Mucuna pruriens]
MVALALVGVWELWGWVAWDICGANHSEEEDVEEQERAALEAISNDVGCCLLLEHYSFFGLGVATTWFSAGCCCIATWKFRSLCFNVSTSIVDSRRRVCEYRDPPCTWQNKLADNTRDGQVSKFYETCSQLVFVLGRLEQCCLRGRLSNLD